MSLVCKLRRNTRATALLLYSRMESEILPFALVFIPSFLPSYFFRLVSFIRLRCSVEKVSWQINYTCKHLVENVQRNLKFT